MLCHTELKVWNLLQKCTFKELKQIHAFILTTSLHQNVQILSKFLRRSTEFGVMDYPNLIFSQMGGTSHVDITICNAMIRGYAFNGPLEMCISMYDEMPQRELKPNNFTYPYVLNSCSELGWFRIGKKVHCQIIKTGFECAFSVANSLFNMYISIDYSFAWKILDDMCFQPIELYNRLISEYTGIGDVESARQLFDDMTERDIVSWNSMISCYAKVGDVENARDLFERMPEKNVISWTCMIGAFAGHGDLETARNCFEKMPERNVVSWNSLLSGYTQNGKFQEALDLFVEMHLEGMDMDGFTFVSALMACSHLGALEFGKWVHSLIKDWPKLAVIVGTALVELYAKCGDVKRAFTIFIKIGNKDVFCFNVMIKSLAIHGRTEDAIKIFYLMQKIGMKPNEFTLSSALFACSHGGLVEEGHQIFCSMERRFGISPKMEHYGCMIDLLSRNGQIEEAEVIIKGMPFKPDIAIWGALLSGCRVRSDLELAKDVIERAGELKVNESGVYVLLSNIYASAGQWPEAMSMRGKMEEKSLWKRKGCSSIMNDHVRNHELLLEKNK